MSTTAQRKAWNEAMRNAAGASALPHLLPQNQKRRSDRRKKQDRRDKARKVQSVSGSADQQEFHAAVWLDALEDIDPSVLAAVDEEEEYDVLEELERDAGKKKGGAKRKRASKQTAGVMPKRFLPRTLGSILVEEANREEGVARAFVEAEARILNPQKRLPRRKFCPVTGLPGIYTEPKIGIPYANWKALEQIRERAPPWMTLGGTPAYWEAAKSLRDEEC